MSGARSGDDIRRMGEAPRSFETILLVDDDPVVRAVASRLLRRSEYSVLEASGGMEALQILRQQEQGVDLMLTDILMPDLSGWELSELVRAEFPAVRILYMSGFADEEVVRTRSLSESNFLPKPFGFESLTRAVQNLLRPGSEAI